MLLFVSISNLVLFFFSKRSKQSRSRKLMHRSSKTPIQAPYCFQAGYRPPNSPVRLYSHLENLIRKLDLINFDFFPVGWHECRYGHYQLWQRCSSFIRACLHGGGAPQIGEVIIDHRILDVKKLCRLTLPTRIINWIIDFLSNLSQRIKLSEGCYSEWGSVPSGVPQGTKLSPWLFRVLINDLDVDDLANVLWGAVCKKNDLA